MKKLLNTLDMKESPEDIAVAPKPRMIPVVYAKAKDIADVLRKVYADRLVIAQNQQNQMGGRGAGIAMMMRGMMGQAARAVLAGRRPRRPVVPAAALEVLADGQNQADQANRIAIGVDTHTNTLVIAAVDTLFEEVKQFVQELDTANAEQHETVQVIHLHRTTDGGRREGFDGIRGRRRANHDSRIRVRKFRITTGIHRRSGPLEVRDAAGSPVVSTAAGSTAAASMVVDSTAAASMVADAADGSVAAGSAADRSAAADLASGPFGGGGPGQ